MIPLRSYDFKILIWSYYDPNAILIDFSLLYCRIARSYNPDHDFDNYADK